MSEDGDYVGSAVTAIEDIEIFDYDEYEFLFGPLPVTGIEDLEDRADYEDQYERDEYESEYIEDE